MQAHDQRRARRNLIEARDKHLIRLDEELNELYQAKRKLPLIKLDKPMHVGWKKYFVLREDVKKGHPHRYKVDKILSKIQHEIHSRRKDFLVEDWKTKKLKPREHSLNLIPENKWPEEFPESYKSFFELKTYERKTYYAFNTQIYRMWKFKPMWMLETRIKPRYATHIQEVDSTVCSRIKEIENFFDVRNARTRLDHLYGYRNRHWDWENSLWDGARHKNKQHIKEALVNEGFFTATD